jgi:GNAT superfamily N-acetyltransferase
MKAFVISRLKGKERKEISRHAVNLLRTPYSASAFSRKARLVSWLPNASVVRIMRLFGYDGLVLKKGEKIASDIFFQRHGNALHVFSVFTQPEFRGTGITEEAIRQFIHHAKTVKGIARVRIGAGGDKAITRKFEALRKEEKSLGIKVLEKGWVELLKGRIQ